MGAWRLQWPRYAGRQHSCLWIEEPYIPFARSKGNDSFGRQELTSRVPKEHWTLANHWKPFCSPGWVHFWISQLPFGVWGIGGTFGPDLKRSDAQHAIMAVTHGVLPFCEVSACVPSAPHFWVCCRLGVQPGTLCPQRCASVSFPWLFCFFPLRMCLDYSCLRVRFLVVSLAAIPQLLFGL